MFYNFIMRCSFIGALLTSTAAPCQELPLCGKDTRSFLQVIGKTSEQIIIPQNHRILFTKSMCNAKLRYTGTNHVWLEIPKGIDTTCITEISQTISATDKGNTGWMGIISVGDKDHTFIETPYAQTHKPGVRDIPTTCPNAARTLVVFPTGADVI